MTTRSEDLKEFPNLKYYLNNYAQYHDFGVTTRDFAEWVVNFYGLAIDVEDCELSGYSVKDILIQGEELAKRDCADCGDEFPNLQADSDGVIRCGVCGNHGINA